VLSNSLAYSTEWVKYRKVIVYFMTKVISTINLKGGVGKTSLTVALAEFLAEEDNYTIQFPILKF
jgi:hypothetical protein